MKYSFKKKVAMSFEIAVQKTKESLMQEDFGILTEIDVKATLKEKLNVDYDNYVILGACNPHFAYEVLRAEKEIGLLLPCNVIVYEEKGEVFVAGIRPTVAMEMIENDQLEDLAQQVEMKLSKVIDNL